MYFLMFDRHPRLSIDAFLRSDLTNVVQLLLKEVHTSISMETCCEF